MVHCQLEKTGLVHKFAENSAISVHTVSDSSGDNDSQICDWVMSGGLQVSENRVSIPEFVAVPSAAFLSIAIRLTVPDGQTQLSIVPPELATSVQFVLRTALPVRAPSIIS